MQARPGVIGVKWSKLVQKVILRPFSYKCDKGLRISGKTFVYEGNVRFYLPNDHT